MTLELSRKAMIILKLEGRMQVNSNHNLCS